MLIANHLTKSVQINGHAEHILNNVSMTVGSGDFLSITGRSGSGKTTLLHVLSTLARPDAGQLHYQGQDISALPEPKLDRIRQSDFSIIFQFHHLFPYLTVLENCLLPFMRSLKSVPKSTMDKARECLNRVGLSHKENMLPGKLSGGEQQRVAIARALVKSSKILFADEPTGSLDKNTGEQIMDLLCSLHQEGLTIVMVTHEPAYADRSNRTIVIEDGAIT